MKKVYLLVAGLLIVAVSIGITSCNPKTSVSLKTAKDSASYALGVYYGEGFVQTQTNLPEGHKMDADAFIAGAREAVDGKSSMDAMAAQMFLNNYFMQVQTAEADKNSKAGKDFLDENKTKPGVITTESGLQYKVITEGSGEKPGDNDKVKVHYTGKLLDGTEFDSTAQHGGEPFEFNTAGGVIQGWLEGVKIMPVGSKYIFWIPSDLAYGERAQGPIPPNSTLEFEIELLEIVK